MSAPDCRVLAGILLLAAAPLFAAGQLEADPHELYEAARNHLKNGDLPAAESAIAQLRGLVTPGSRWDPDGVFAKELLPPLSARLRRMQDAARELDAFCADALEEIQPPDRKPDGPALRDYTEWAASQIENLRAKRDRILATKLANPEERAALARTPSYACSERVLETDVLKSLAVLPEPDSSLIVSGDPEVDPIVVRFRQLKQDLMETIAERDQLRQAAKRADAREAAFLAALSDIMTHGLLPAPSPGAPGPKAASDLFQTFLDQELKSLRHRASQTSRDLEIRRADLNRYRRYNALLVQTGLGADQKARLERLEEALEAVPVDDQLPPGPSGGGRSGWIAAGALGFLSGASIALAVARRRKRPAAPPIDSPALIHGPQPSPSSVDDHAA